MDTVSTSFWGDDGSSKRSYHNTIYIRGITFGSEVLNLYLLFKTLVDPNDFISILQTFCFLYKPFVVTVLSLWNQPRTLNEERRHS